MRKLLLALWFVASSVFADACPQAFLQEQAKNANGTTTGWTAICSSDPRDGGGGFLQFLTPNKAGQWVSGVTFNGGLVDATPGKEQGDLDIGFYVDGKSVVVGFAGRWAGLEPGMGVWPPDLLWIGNASGRFAGISLTEVPCPPSVPGNPVACVRVGSGFSPVYR